MRSRHVTTGVTLAVLVAILAVGGYLGLQKLFAPVPGDSSSTAKTCTATTLGKGAQVRSRQVEVSVFNGGSRSGLADRTMIALTNRGFKEGDIGNAPDGSDIKVAQVWTTKSNDPAAHLVARQFGPGIKVEIKSTDLGPGVDVLVGNGFTSLKKASRVITVQDPASVCVPDASPSPSN